MPDKLGRARVEDFRLGPGDPLPSPPPEGEGTEKGNGKGKRDEIDPRTSIILLMPSP